MGFFVLIFLLSLLLVFFMRIVLDAAERRVREKLLEFDFDLDTWPTVSIAKTSEATVTESLSEVEDEISEADRRERQRLVEEIEALFWLD